MAYQGLGKVKIQYEEFVPDSGPVVREVELDPDTDLQIDETNIDFEACHIGNLVALYGHILGELKAQHARDEANIKFLYSQMDIYFRKPGNHEGKITETKLEQMIKNTQQWQDAVRKANETLLYLSKMEYWFQGLRRKYDMINTISNNRRQEMKTAY